MGTAHYWANGLVKQYNLSRGFGREDELLTAWCQFVSCMSSTFPPRCRYLNGIESFLKA